MLIKANTYMHTQSQIETLDIKNEHLNFIIVSTEIFKKSSSFWIWQILIYPSDQLNHQNL